MPNHAEFPQSYCINLFTIGEEPILRPQSCPPDNGAPGLAVVWRGLLVYSDCCAGPYTRTSEWTHERGRSDTGGLLMQQVLFEIPIPGWADGLPIYGFGMMLFLSFVACTLLLSVRGRARGVCPP